MVTGPVVLADLVGEAALRVPTVDACLIFGKLQPGGVLEQCPCRTLSIGMKRSPRVAGNLDIGHVEHPAWDCANIDIAPAGSICEEIAEERVNILEIPEGLFGRRLLQLRNRLSRDREP